MLPTTLVLLISASLWFYSAVFVFLSPHPFPALRGFGVVWFPFTGAIIALVWFVLAIRKQSMINILFPAIIILVSAFIFLEAHRDIAAAHFYINRASYEARAKALLAMHERGHRDKACGNDGFFITHEPPRVAFHYLHGFLSWFDFVHDPSGENQTNDLDKRKRINIYSGSAQHLAGD